MDRSLRTAVEDSDVEAVRLRLGEVDPSTLGAVGIGGETILHLATQQHCRVEVLLEIVALLVEEMNEEQVSILDSKGGAAIRNLWVKQFGMRWQEFLTQSEPVAMAMMEKMTETAAMACDVGGWSAVGLACSQHSFGVVRLALDMLGDSIVADSDQDLVGNVLTSRTWAGDEEAEATLLRMIDVMDVDLLQKSAIHARKLIAYEYPVSCLLRVLDRQRECGRDPCVADHQGNLWHTVARTGREKLLEPLAPYVDPAHLHDKTNWDKTPAELAEATYERKGRKAYLRIAALLRPRPKAAIA